MSAMDESPYGDEVVQEVPAVRWHWTFPIVRVLSLAGNIANAHRAFFCELAADVGSHAQFQMERDEFAASAGRELETLLENSEEN